MSSRIYAARVGIDGQVLSPVGFEIAPSATGVQENPRVAFYGGVFLVVWQDLRNGKDDDILGARISMTGKLIDTKPLVIASAPRSQVMPDVDADDEGFMVVWHGFQGDEKLPHIFAARVWTDGTVGQPAIVADGASPRIAWNSTEHFVAYSSAVNSSIIQQTRAWLRMDKATQPLPQSGLGFIYQPANGPNYYSVCAMPQRDKGWVIVTHEDPGNPWGRTIGVQRAINITASDGTIAADSPTYETGAYIEKYNATEIQIPANWLDTSLGKSEQKLWPWGGSALAQDGQYCVAVWSRYHMSKISMYNSDIMVGRVDRWKPLDGDGIAVAASAASERNPALAGNSAGALLTVYEKMQDGITEIVARKLSISASTIQVGNEVQIMSSDGPGKTRRANPDVVFGSSTSGNPAVFMVVWQEGWHGAGL